MNLYFRGYDITIGQLNSIHDSHNIFRSDSEIVVAGTSAGGIAALQWTNYIKNRS